MPSRVPRRVLVPLIVACALFMENLDSTVIATALPEIARSMNENPLHLRLAITSSLLILSGFIPASAWPADLSGARLIFSAPARSDERGYGTEGVRQEKNVGAEGQ